MGLAPAQKHHLRHVLEDIYAPALMSRRRGSESKLETPGREPRAPWPMVRCKIAHPAKI
jgi:hypothetical protein